MIQYRFVEALGRRQSMGQYGKSMWTRREAFKMLDSSIR